MTTEPTRQEVDALDGVTLLEFGASWCPHCVRAQPAIADALSRHPYTRHLKIEVRQGSSAREKLSRQALADTDRAPGRQ